MEGTSRSQTVRAFIAVEISEGSRAALAELATRLKRTEAGVSWTRPGSIHLTLRFLGDIAADRVDEIAAAMNEACQGLAPIPVELGGWGTFPANKRPRVIWVGLTSGAAPLATLFVRLETALVARGFGPADKPFSPHLTLGRVKSGQNLASALKVMESHAGRSLGAFTADRIILFQSELHPTGAVYTKLRQAPLR
jgi:RNA 2',3'-cyclic 3'-phosphodiesterase